MHDADAAESAEANIGKPARLSRKEALRQFQEWLKSTNQPFVVPDAAKQVQSSDTRLGTLDLILYTEPKNRLVTVRKKLSPVETHDMHEWQRTFGAGFEAVRVWPDKGPDGSSWHFHPVE